MIITSLWLVPPTKESNTIQEQITFLANKHKGSPSFAPHITIGGAPVTSETKEDALALFESCKTRVQKLSSSGGITCKFTHLDSANNPADGSLCRFQACMAIVELPNASFIELCKLVQDQEDETKLFNAPIDHPHLSLAYGANCVQDATLPETFDAHEVQMVDVTSDDVGEWNCISSFSILGL
mmetsp:Transcript_30127/g.46133  ORF Transcript_30127/g.46133 Transcript_30127/m.46133 type:complete len:183 (+) Transcript_30127:1-549(+)